MTWYQFVYKHCTLYTGTLTFPDPLNDSGKATFVQRGKWQCWGGEHSLLQLQPCTVCDMLSLPVWKENPEKQNEKCSKLMENKMIRKTSHKSTYQHLFSLAAARRRWWEQIVTEEMLVQGRCYKQLEKRWKRSQRRRSTLLAVYKRLPGGKNNKIICVYIFKRIPVIKNNYYTVIWPELANI